HPHEVCARRNSGSDDRHNGVPDAAYEHPGCDPDNRVRVPVRYGLVAADRRNRVVIEPHFGNDSGDAAADLSDISPRRLGRAYILRYGAVGGRHRVHSFVKWRDYLAGPQDRIPGGLDSAATADCDPGGRSGIGARPWPDSDDPEPELDCVRSADDI